VFQNSLAALQAAFLSCFPRAMPWAVAVLALQAIAKKQTFARPKIQLSFTNSI